MANDDDSKLPVSTESLVAEVSPDVAPAVQEFMAASAAANVAEQEAAAEDTAFAASAGLAGASFAEAPGGPYIAFEHVNKSFGDFVVLKDVSFFVNPGETLCILGRSGVGKSVSLQILMGFLKPDNGTVLVAGQDISGLTEREMQEVRRKVTMVFQNGALFDSITVGENVAFPLRERGHMEEDQIQQVVRGLLEMVGVAGMEHLLPSDLSTGMKRSVAIARALAAQPSAVLYDEPTTMVDPLMAHLLGDLIQRLKVQLHLTSIVVTHDMRFAEKLADRVVFLHEGTVHFFGTTEEMRQSNDPVLSEFLALDELVLPV
jgi:phospholipid/cholesterol/gamma-HCH transport system ATP-binding protein